MLEIKRMRVNDFINSKDACNEEILEKMYTKLKNESKCNTDRLYRGASPLYKCGINVYGGGDCIRILSHRDGYGYTVIDVGDRGYWYCCVRDEDRKYEDISFYDGDIEEVFLKLEKIV